MSGFSDHCPPLKESGGVVDDCQERFEDGASIGGSMGQCVP